MVNSKSTGAVASFTPEQRQSLREVVTLLNSYLAGHASVDAALTLAAIRARRGGIDALDFVATVRALAPTASVPAALVAWLNGAPPGAMLPPVPPLHGFADDDARADFYARR